MSEIVEQVAAHESPLAEAHQKLGALLTVQDGWRVPASYGDTAGEYKTVREGGAGLIDLSLRGRVEVGGADAEQFLNGLITNDVKTLGEDQWMAAVFPNPQGRILASARVIRRGASFLFDTDAVTREQIAKTLGRFTLAGDFSVRDVTRETALVSVQGKSASAVIQRALDERVANVERGRVARAEWQSESVSVIRATHTAEDGFDLFVNSGAILSLWDALREAGASAVGFDALETLRVEAGIPRFGVDMDETKVVLETGLDEAVSFTKGCYIGQEIIARIHWRGHVAKRLAGLILDEEGKARGADKIRDENGKETGWITSAAFSPQLNRTIALGYLKYEYLAPGTSLRVVHNETEHTARVAELPLVRGSWYEQVAESTERKA